MTEQTVTRRRSPTGDHARGVRWRAAARRHRTRRLTDRPACGLAEPTIATEAGSLSIDEKNREDFDTLIERDRSHNVLLEEIAFAATAMARADNWRNGIDALLERLGRSVNVSRVYLFELGRTDEGELTHTCRHDWAAPGLDRLAGSARYTHEIIENYDPEFDSWMDRRRRARRSAATREN